MSACSHLCASPRPVKFDSTAEDKVCTIEKHFESEMNMLRLAFRFGFWACLGMMALPGPRELVLTNGLSKDTISRSVTLASADLKNFCSRHLGICNVGEAVAMQAVAQAKTSLTSAYRGVRTQFDEPDRENLTGSIKRQNKP